MARIGLIFLITICRAVELIAAQSDQPSEPKGNAAGAESDGSGPDRSRDNPALDLFRFENDSIVTVHQLKHSPPREARKAYGKGRQFLENRKFDEAIVWLGKAVAIDPEYSNAHNDLAAAYIRTGRIERAIPLLNSAIDFDPHWGLAYFNLAVAYLSVNELPQAERAARRMAEVDVGSQQAAFVLGLSLAMQNRFTPEAQAALTRAEPMFPEAGLLLAKILAGRGELETAKLRIVAYLASPARWGREMAGEWLKLLDAY